MDSGLYHSRFRLMMLWVPAKPTDGLSFLCKSCQFPSPSKEDRIVKESFYFLYTRLCPNFHRAQKSHFSLRSRNLSIYYVYVLYQLKLYFSSYSYVMHMARNHYKFKNYTRQCYNLITFYSPRRTVLEYIIIFKC